MLELRNVTMTVHSDRKTTLIISDISLTIDTGESVGLVGESGSGKSMTLRTILRSEPANATVSGEILLDGHDIRTMDATELRGVRAHRVAMISQNPQAVLNPVEPVVRYLIEGMHDARGVPVREAKARARELLEQVGIENVDRVLKAYPHELSGGMLQRVVIAGAVAGKPQLLLADEPTTALDVTTQAEVVSLLDEYRRERGMSMIFVTHDLDLAAAVSDRIAVMAAGEIVEIGTPQQLRETPLHPYTKLLMKSRPQVERSVATLPVIPGQPVAAGEVLRGCRFAPRCPWVQERCRVNDIPLVTKTVPRANSEPGGERAVRCIRADELAKEDVV